jgi:hypothetical protein
MDESVEVLREKLNQETGRMDWPALARHFARGVVIKVRADMDLVEVAAAFSTDDKHTVGQWLADGRIAKAEDADARSWQENGVTFWAVVAAPWVLVQEIRPGLTH